MPISCKGCKFPPADFRHRITVEEPSLVSNDTGGQVETWTTFATMWAIVEPKHGNEQLISQRVDAVDVYQIVVRYFPGIAEKMRIQWNSMTLQIKSVILINGLKEFVSIKAIDTGPGT